MENKNVGWLIIGIGVVMVLIVWIFNNAMKSIVGASCSMVACPMYDTIATQTNLSLGIVAVIIIIGVVIMFTKPKERIVVKKVKEAKKKLDLEDLDKEEKEVVKMLQEENGAIFQKTLMEKMEVGKVKITRLLDKLEAKQLIERKRRGMNNIVVLKD